MGIKSIEYRKKRKLGTGIRQSRKSNKTNELERAVVYCVNPQRTRSITAIRWLYRSEVSFG